jgi:hypothetical protein
MKESKHMPPLAGVERATRTGLGRWSAGKGAAVAWRLPAAPLSIPVFFPLRAAAMQAEAPTPQPKKGVQIDLFL